MDEGAVEMARECVGYVRERMSEALRCVSKPDLDWHGYIEAMHYAKVAASDVESLCSVLNLMT